MTPQGPHKFPLLMTAQNKDLCSLTRVPQSSRTSWVSQPSPHFSAAWQPLLTGSSAGTQHCNAQASSGSTNQQGRRQRQAGSSLQTAALQLGCISLFCNLQNTHLSLCCWVTLLPTGQPTHFRPMLGEHTAFNVEVSYISCREKIRNCNKHRLPNSPGRLFSKGLFRNRHQFACLYQS